MTKRLATSTITAQLSNLRGRAIVSARGHHFVADSPVALGGPSEEVSPLDLLLSSLGSCCLFVCERAALEQGFPLLNMSVSVAGDSDPRGIYGEPVESRIQAIRVWVIFQGITEEQSAVLVDALKTRCPIYTTLVRSVPITVDARVEN